jgi:hypothetical protein
MKLTLTISLAAALFATTGCTTLLSTNAFVAEEEALVDPHLAGTWTNDGDTILIRPNGKAYEITYVDKGKDAMKFVARLVKVGDAMLLDLSRDSDDPFVMALHFAVRVWPETATLRWTLVDSDWLKEQAVQFLPAQRDGDRTIVTAPVPAVREFMRRFGGDERASGKIETWTRAQ